MDGLVGLSRLHIAMEVDAERLRPSDNPVVLGNRSRILEEVGWAPEIPIERTLADLLDYWRQRVGSAPQS